MLKMYYQAYKHIFTSPTSAEDIDDQRDLEEHAPRPHKRSRRQRAPTRGNIANIMGMGSVTPRSIAYVAVQVRGKG
jgi:hypothetical protein